MKGTIARACVVVVALAVLGAAWAHGPTRRKVQESIEIDAPQAKVWAVIGNFQDMSWLAGVSKTEGDKGNEIGATRRLTLTQGATIDEELYKYDADMMSYSYRITAVDVKVLPVTNYSSTLTVSPAPDGKAKLEWAGAFYRGYPNNDPPPELNDEAAIKAVSGLYRAGLEALKKKIESGS
ncbi:SRPBCC family protein [Bradyrhizobium sp. ISRA443]|uniref:SRPBCC family protein n=1 Tax=unclassified Bradyrhizobium TaxID=2631580 RepID=UPI00247A21B0|nr:MULTISPECIES: SRPBCC family protein [unclassified Bradyrhizobium]WGR92054.1 SRPBCC family protein [Bradyrhizobium sp. ISRA435]WGS02495.1 SRPBCC family protein [Bradyrhizobium sp. ISRA436]WGS09380.1 SRPBCC family protein [Bradyrhizobium sp. ISRA437]WGS16269.1 SRPBCC family protein [Bradyrhizobium sp. ISRA443]